MRLFIKLGLGWILLLIIRSLRPLVKIRIGMLHHTRIGHLAANTEYWLRKESLNPTGSGELRLFISSSRPANRQLLTMIKRRLRVVESSILDAVLTTAHKRWPDLPVWLDLTATGTHDYELWSNTRPQLAFTPDELRRGEALLRSMGIPEGARFVCLAIRDRAYLEGHMTNKSWRYHDYRDGDIERCRPAAEWLAAQGLWVIRMGAAVSKPFSSADPRIIDYANRFRSDFGDIFLLGSCKFYIGDTAGLFWPACMLGVPTALINSVPITHLHIAAGSMVMPKIYRRKGGEKPLTYNEVVSSGMDGYFRSELYEAAGIEVVENTAEDILGLAREMNARVDGAWVAAPEDEKLQARFWAAFPPGHRSHGCPARVPADFLRRNEEVLA